MGILKEQSGPGGPLLGSAKSIYYFLVQFSSADPTGGNLLHNNETYHDRSTGESSLPLVAKIVGSLVLALLCLSGVLWFAFRYRRKSR